MHKLLHIELLHFHNFSCSYTLLASQIERIATLLLDHEAIVIVARCDGNTPLHLAAKYGYLSVAKKLLKEEFLVSTKNKEGEMPLDIAAKHRHWEFTAWMINYPLSDRWVSTYTNALCSELFIVQK